MSVSISLKLIGSYHVNTVRYYATAPRENPGTGGWKEETRDKTRINNSI